MPTMLGAKTLALLATVVVASVVVALVLAPPTLPSLAPASSSSGSTTGSPGSSARVMIPFGVGSDESLGFQPPSITVVVGVNNTVVWSDLDAEQHTVTSMSVPPGAAKFDSGILNQGQTFTVTFTVAGTYRYYCTIHPTWMRGTIVVRT